jgi:hypothetical protein
VRDEGVGMVSGQFSRVWSDYQRDFNCGICGRIVTMRWNRTGPDEIIPPICASCEREFSHRIGKPIGGTLRDRREVRRGFAVAEALHSEACRMKWEKQYGWA